MKSREWLFGFFSSLAPLPAIAHLNEPPRDTHPPRAHEPLKTKAAGPKLDASNRDPKIRS